MLILTHSSQVRVKWSKLVSVEEEVLVLGIGPSYKYVSGPLFRDNYEMLRDLQE